MTYLGFLMELGIGVTDEINLKEKIQNSREIHLHMKKKQNGCHNVNCSIY